MAYTTIDDPSAHFQAVNFAGNQTARTITFGGNSDLQGDLFWCKERNSAVNWHRVLDTSRGANTSSCPVIYSNSNAAETANTGGDQIRVIGTNSVQIGTGQGINTDSNEMSWWVWKANGGTRTTNTESGNNPGGGYQANTTAGFSIVDYVGTGAAGTMAHGLGAIPHLMIIKNRPDIRDWRVYHKAYGAQKYLDLDTTAALGDASTPFNDTDPTSSVFTVGSDGGSNDDGDNIIAYVWTEKQGYSKFGSYTGNGNANGPFVYTGFKPAWLLYKNLDSVSNWILRDNKSTSGGGSNPNGTVLLANEPAAESVNDSATVIDLLSNGFKIRNNENNDNTDDDDYIYAAFAHQPFVTSGGVPCTAH